MQLEPRSGRAHPDGGRGSTEADVLATIRDVAEAAGVALSTVSHVFNGTAPISEGTRQRVLQAAARLGYVPRRRRRNGSNRQQVVIFKNVIPAADEEGWSFQHEDLAEAIVVAAYRVFKERGVDVWVVPFEKDEVAQGIDPSYYTGFSGALVVDSSVSSFSSLPELPLPTVLAYCIAEAKPVLSVVPDDFRGGYEATRHLIRLGRRRIGFVSGPTGWIVCKERHSGYLAALHEFGLEADEAREASGDWSVESGRQAAAAILERGSDVDALFVANDLMALGAIRALRERGLRVPEDVAVVGYDNRAVAAVADPPLTTVQLPLGNIGRRAAQELLRLMERRPAHADTPASRVQIHCPLVIRDSCGYRLVQASTPPRPDFSPSGGEGGGEP